MSEIENEINSVVGILESQKKRIIDMTKNIEACAGIPVRIISSRYMASDMAFTIK